MTALRRLELQLDANHARLWLFHDMSSFRFEVHLTELKALRGASLASSDNAVLVVNSSASPWTEAD